MLPLHQVLCGAGDAGMTDQVSVLELSEKETLNDILVKNVDL